MSVLRNEIDGFFKAQKAELLEVVWESLEADALSPTDAQRAELDYRISRHEQSPSDVIPWDKVKARLFKETLMLRVVWLAEGDDFRTFLGDLASSCHKPGLAIELRL